MTPARSNHVDLEFARAAGALTSARVLLDAGQFADAISRAYYAVFHAASALLASIGRSARTHDGVRALIAEHFIRPGVLAQGHGRTLARVAGDRGEADYNVAAVFTEADVREDIELATTFLAAARAIVEESSA